MKHYALRLFVVVNLFSLTGLATDPLSAEGCIRLLASAAPPVLADRVGLYVNVVKEIPLTAADLDDLTPKNQYQIKILPHFSTMKRSEEFKATLAKLGFQIADEKLETTGEVRFTVYVSPQSPAASQTQAETYNQLFTQYPEVAAFGRVSRSIFDSLASTHDLGITSFPRPLLPYTPFGSAQSSPLVPYSHQSGLELFRAVVEKNGTDTNTALSPYGSQSVLLTAMLGAKGLTLAQMKQKLGLLGLKFEDVIAAFAAQKANLEKVYSEDNLRFVPGVFTNTDLVGGKSGTLLPDYRQKVERLGASVAAFSFSNGEAVKREAIIRGKWGDTLRAVPIPQIPNLSVLLYSYLQVAGNWAKSFRLDGEKPFHLTPATEIKVPMMSRTAEMPYILEKDYQAVQLAFERSHMVMELVLPTGRTADQFVAEKMSGGFYQGIVDRFNAPDAKKNVALTVPRIEGVEVSVNLKAAYESLGLTEPFSPQADFTALAVGGGSISVFDQTVKFYMTEKKAGASAFTRAAVVYLGVDSAPENNLIPLVFDRPYLAFIRDKYTGEILFAVIIRNPLK